MIILTIRSDNPEAEIGLYEDDRRLAYDTWLAHRQLAETIHTKIYEAFEKGGHTVDDIGGIIVFRGPGSFTGLRIGISVANALAYGLDVPVAGAMGQDWIQDGRIILEAGRGMRQVVPEYGAPVHITAPKR